VSIYAIGLREKYDKRPSRLRKPTRISFLLRATMAVSQRLHG